MKLRYFRATHVMVGYCLPGNNVAYDEGYCGDGEHGEGRRLLKILKDKSMLYTMLVVVRNYGGRHLGPARFNYIADAGSDALSKLCQGETRLHTLPYIVSPVKGTVKHKVHPPPARKLAGSFGALPSLRNPPPPLLQYNSS